MCKHTIRLTLVEMFAIKHALERQVYIKNKRLEYICTQEDCWDRDIEEEFKTLEKDLEHERELISRLEREIKEYRESKKVS